MQLPENQPDTFQVEQQRTTMQINQPQIISNSQQQINSQSTDKKRIILFIAFGVIVTLTLGATSFMLMVSKPTNKTQLPSTSQSNPEGKSIDSQQKPSTQDAATHLQTTQDQERMQDLNTLKNNLEAYIFSVGPNKQVNGTPLLSQLNYKNWCAANLKTTSDEILKDPVGSSPILAATPTKDNYSFEVRPKGCDNKKNSCEIYRLTAVLSNGSHFIVKDSAETRSGGKVKWEDYP